MRWRANPGHVKNRQQLMDAANVVLDDNTITSHIKRLRRKFIEVDPAFDADPDRVRHGISLDRVSIRLQLLIVALTTLILPWAGCQYARELENALRGLAGERARGELRTRSRMHSRRSPSAPSAVSTIRRPFAAERG